MKTLVKVISYMIKSIYLLILNMELFAWLKSLLQILQWDSYPSISIITPLVNKKIQWGFQTIIPLLNKS